MENFENDAVAYLTKKIKEKDNVRIIWCLGLWGDSGGTGLLGLLQHLTVKAVCNMVKPKYIIRLSIPAIVYQVVSNEPSAFRMETHMVIAVANALGIMDEIKYCKELKDELDEELFYNDEVVYKQKESNLVDKLLNEIHEKLRNTNYLLVIEYYFSDVISNITMKWLLDGGWLPQPSKWNGARWVISVCDLPWTSENRDVFLKLDDLIRTKNGPLEPHQVVELALQVCAQSVAPALFPRVRGSAVRVRETIDILRSCLLHSLLYSPRAVDQLFGRYIPRSIYEDFFLNELYKIPGMKNISWVEILNQLSTKIPYRDNWKSKLIKENIGRWQSNSIDRHKEIVCLWVAEGIFNQSMAGTGDEEEEVNLADSLHAANVVLEALLSHSLIHSIASEQLTNDRKYLFNYFPVPFVGALKLLGSYMGTQMKISSPINWWENNRGISILQRDYGKWIKHPQPNKITTFLYRFSYILSQSTIDNLLITMSNLRVLDFSYSSLEALPASIVNLTNLRFFSLRGCEHIRTLRARHSELDSRSPIEMLEKLEVLNLNGVPLTEVPEEIGRQKRRLHFLDLSCPKITSFPQNLFAGMSILRELSLLGCNSLESLPSSLATLIHLEVLSISQTQLDSLPCNTFEQMQLLRVLKLASNRRLVHLPNSLSRASMLQELHIHDCTALREVNVAGHPSLKSFSLSKSPQITRLSLRACQALDTLALSDLENLTELDLSFTSIKEFPLEVYNQGSLKRLDLISVPQLNRVPWHKLCKPLPEVFNLVPYEHKVMGNKGLVVQDSVDDSLQLLKDGIGVKIFFRDSRLLSMFKSNQLLENQGANPRLFYVSLGEQRNQQKNINMTSNNQFHNRNPYYKSVHQFENKFIQQFVESHLRRQMEICSMGRYPSGLQGILSFTESLLIRHDAFVSSLTDLNPEFPELQQCKLEWCHRMEVVFRETNLLKGKKLQNLWVSNLSNLTDVLHGQFRFDEFWALKYVKLWDCPRLVSVFPGNLKFPYLETLSIVRCYSLRTLFYYCQPNDEDQFPRLHSVKLHQLPQLSELYDSQEHPFRMPEWKELTFRGCWSLFRLPLLTRPRDQKVFVDGDIRQCKTFESKMDKDQLSCFHFKSLPPVASFKEHVRNMIFLK